LKIVNLSTERVISGVDVSSMKGFLGTGATFGADLNFVVQLVMGVALLAGALLAKHKRYKAHGICQTAVLLLNLLMIGLVMWPSFQHGVLGIVAEFLGLYIVLVAGTDVLPQWLRFKHWKWWMRTELALWMIVLLSGLGTYCAWYLTPFR
jgi:uncharacterized membrane protein YozB (DUF420 family)